MSNLARRRKSEEVAPEAEVENEPQAPKKRRSHRAAYPTPGFKAFAALLNLLAVPIAAYLVVNTDEKTMSLFGLALLTLVGLGVVTYSTILRPLPTNLQQRKVLAGVTAAYGFLMLVAVGLTILL